MAAAFAAALLVTSSANAHVGFSHVGLSGGAALAQAGFAPSFLTGFLHPLSGLDHVIAMMAVGLWAAPMQPKARIATIGGFLAAMFAGALCAAAGLALPSVEYGIAGSVVFFGLMIALDWRLTSVSAAALAGFFALFHGYAHGTELPAAVAFAGFLSASALLLLAGLGLGRVLARQTSPVRQVSLKLGGLLLAVVGGWLALAVS